MNEDKQEGRKDDSGKLRFDLVPPESLMKLVEVYTIGSKKYSTDIFINWEDLLLIGRDNCSCYRKENLTVILNFLSIVKGSVGTVMKENLESEIQSLLRDKERILSDGLKLIEDGNKKQTENINQVSGIKTENLSQRERECLLRLGYLSMMRRDYLESKEELVPYVEDHQERDGSTLTMTMRRVESEVYSVEDVIKESVFWEIVQRELKEHYDTCKIHQLKFYRESGKVKIHITGDRNWEKGLKWGRVFAAMERHAWAWWNGEQLDPVDKQHHLASVAWCAFTLMEYEKTHPELDDRVKKGR